METPKEYQLKCNSCRQIMDMRDLSQVFAHEDCNGIPVDYDKIEQVEYSGSKKNDSPIFHTKDKKEINLN